ncbi:hypothetical protein J6590_061851 [Homalodisca vitripennis]|nr:hypothetical protein J6590_061851 [Homalodisca vitripennis]
MMVHAIQWHFAERYDETFQMGSTLDMWCGAVCCIPSLGTREQIAISITSLCANTPSTSTPPRKLAPFLHNMMATEDSNGRRLMKTLTARRLQKR